jgi:hypothetical protein
MDQIQARELRRRRRAFARAHHPDRGGDSDFFAAGLRAFDSVTVPVDGTLPRVVITKRRPWPVRLVSPMAGRIGRSAKPPRVR